MRNAWLMIGVVALLSGCHSQSIDDRANNEVAAARAAANNDMLHASCTDQSVLRPSCGLIANRVAMADFRESFRQKHCSDGASAEECDDRLAQSTDEWLEQRYFRASFRDVDATCNATPGRCDDPAEREVLLMDSHNAAARGIAEQHERAIAEDRRVAHLEEQCRRQNSRGAVGAVAGFMSRGARYSPLEPCPSTPLQSASVQ